MAQIRRIVLIAATVVAISEGQQPVGENSQNDSELSLQNEFLPSTCSTAPAIDEDNLVGDGLCRLTTTDQYVHKKVIQMLIEDKVTLIDYQLNFTGYTRNPLTVNMAGAYDAKKWSRVTLSLIHISEPTRPY